MKEANHYREEYLLKLPTFESLAKNLCSALELILQENKIDYLKVYYRIKDLDSFIEKIERKKYKDPFSDTEDICGIRVICYYQKDVDIITGILTKELDIKESQDKEDSLEINQFGYRSHHLITRIPIDWLKTPNFRNLKDLKAEIQIRTVLMHAWAEIEHKLSYKKKSHIPDNFKRKLYRLSAKLEESDEQFQELKEQSNELQKELIQKVKDNQVNFSNVTDLNLDTLQAFLDFHFPDRTKNPGHTRDLLDRMQTHNISLADFEAGFKKINPHLGEIESSIFKEKKKGWSQMGIANWILDLTNEKYLKARGEEVRQDKLYWMKKLKI